MLELTNAVIGSLQALPEERREAAVQPVATLTEAINAMEAGAFTTADLEDLAAETLPRLAAALDSAGGLVLDDLQDRIDAVIDSLSGLAVPVTGTLPEIMAELSAILDRVPTPPEGQPADLVGDIEAVPRDMDAISCACRRSIWPFWERGIHLHLIPPNPSLRPGGCNRRALCIQAATKLGCPPHVPGSLRR
ncbi:MAG: hypothetical protein AAF713_20990 [Pseudomonadota bacterium]